MSRKDVKISTYDDKAKKFDMKPEPPEQRYTGEKARKRNKQLSQQKHRSKRSTK